MTIRIIEPEQLTAGERTRILALCSAAYEMEFTPYLDALPAPIHLVLERDGQLVSHAAIVERQLLADDRIMLFTAYVEAVATTPPLQGRGYGTEIMRAVADFAANAKAPRYDLAALSPSDAGYYTRLGWELWQGPLWVRADTGNYATPDEEVMIMRLPATPTLDLTTKLSCEWRPLEEW